MFGCRVLEDSWYAAMPPDDRKAYGFRADSEKDRRLSLRGHLKGERKSIAFPYIGGHSPIAYATLTQEEIMAINSFADKLVKKIFGSSSNVFLKNVKPVVVQIQAWEPAMEKMSDDELKAQTPKFKEIIQNALNGIDDKA